MAPRRNTPNRGDGLGKGTQGALVEVKLHHEPTPWSNTVTIVSFRESSWIATDGSM